MSADILWSDHVGINRFRSSKKTEITEIIRLLMYGYSEQLTINKMPNEIREIIHLYFPWTLSEVSMKCIAGTHLIASLLDEFLNDKKNKCQFSNIDNDLNVLKHIYIRGGSLRDSCLLRKIKDVDIIIDIRTLSQKYSSHLKKYHSKIEIKSKCIYYRHYMNKYKSQNNIQSYNLYTTHRNKYKNAAKILSFCSKISDCDFVLNSRFIRIALLSAVSRKNNIDIRSIKNNIRRDIKRIDDHWEFKLYCSDYHGMQLQRISFDVVDGSGSSYSSYYSFCSYRFQTLQQYQSLYGIDNEQQIISEIDEYYKSLSNKNEISVPIYPFPINIMSYDFTINSMHIDLYSVLTANNAYSIDFNWAKKIKIQFNENMSMNEFNVIGLNDIQRKVLIAPSLDAINAFSAELHFWRLVKTAHKFIDKLQCNIWKIDDKYLKHTINLYPLWFTNSTKFVSVFLNWNIENKMDIIDRLRVFRIIKFEQFFKQKLMEYPDFALLIRHCADWNGDQINVLRKFGYPPSLFMNTYKTHGQCTFCLNVYGALFTDPWISSIYNTYADCICTDWIKQNDWFLDYNYVQNKTRSRRKNKELAKNGKKKRKKLTKNGKRKRCKNRKKVESHFKHKADKQQNAKSIEKFKNRYRYSLSLEY